MPPQVSVIPIVEAGAHWMVRASADLSSAPASWSRAPRSDVAIVAVALQRSSPSGHLHFGIWNTLFVLTASPTWRHSEKEALSDSGMSFAEADRAWVSNATSDRPQPFDATYYAVTAESEAPISDAVKAAARYRRWPEGEPFYVVIAEREPPTIPATESI